MSDTSHHLGFDRWSESVRVVLGRRKIHQSQKRTLNGQEGRKAESPGRPQQHEGQGQ